MIKEDFHVHTKFSGDSLEKVENQIDKAIELGLEFLCITDHCDFNLYSKKEYVLDVDSYVNEINVLKGKYKNRIKLLLGIEMGLVPSFKEKINNFLDGLDFDFVIGSSHAVNGIDIGHNVSKYFGDKSEKQAYGEYFKSILENVKIFDNYDVYGHLDYVVRYGPYENKHFDIKDYKDVIYEILKIIIEKGKGIEINTAGVRKSLGYAHPHKDILKLYKDLGGEIITIGSDAHACQHLGYKFEDVPELLKSAGFKYYTVFENRQPKFLDI